MVNNRTGFSLVEVIVAMTLLSIGALAVAATSIIAVQSFTRAEMQQHLLDEAGAVLDSLVALRANAAGSRSMHQAVLSWSAADSNGVVNVSAHGPAVSFTLTGAR